MKVSKFHTNISSECCVRYLAHYFSGTSIKNWNVNLNDPLKVLTVENAKVSAEDVIIIVRKAGHEIEEIKNTNELLYRTSLN